jgi:carbon starvation protein CstA
MTTFFLGLLILIVGGMLYGSFVEKILRPDNRIVPAYSKSDGVDFVPMKTWKNSLINLLNIAGTGPILGPIQGILFGPIAFILIPVGCVLGGAMHDYFSGMLSLRNDGAQMPTLVKKYTNSSTHAVYLIFIGLLMPLVGAVFVYTPGDIASTQLFGFSGSAAAISTWIIYGAIFVYYVIATLFPIDKIIGRLYPIFGAILLLSTFGVFAALFIHGCKLDNLSFSNWMGIHPGKDNLLPIFFVTVACGIVSGFHSTQTSIIARSVTHEKQGRMTFYNMMIAEGFIAMVWAAAAMAIMNAGKASGEATAMVGIISREMLGNAGGLFAIFGAIVLPITSGDTALRGLRLMVAEKFNIGQKSMISRLKISLPIFAIVAAILAWAKMSPNGFTILWRYFAWCNQTIALFAFAIIAIYLMGKGRKLLSLIAIVPGAWYAFITVSYICNARIGLHLSMPLSYVLGAGFAFAYAAAVFRFGERSRKGQAPMEATPIYRGDE